jgi:hypothetical protein
MNWMKFVFLKEENFNIMALSNMAPCSFVDKYADSVEHTASYFYPEYQSNNFL